MADRYDKSVRATDRFASPGGTVCQGADRSDIAEHLTGESWGPLLRHARLAAADAVATGADLIRAAALLVGADATHRTHPLERLTRDSQMLVHHVSVNAPSQERLGTVLLGSYRGPAGLI